MPRVGFWSEETSLAKITFVLILGFVLSTILSELYAIFAIFGFRPWIAAGLANTLLAFVLCFVLFYRHMIDRKFFSVRSFGSIYSLPALLVIASCVVLAFLTRMLIPSSEVSLTRYVSNEQWFLCLWIPLVEEMIFRAGLALALRKIFSDFWAIYLSAFFFAYLHSNPTVGRLMAFEIGLPLGPFLLGVICAMLLFRSAHFWPAVFFHSACNFSVVIFSWMDARWLSWLSSLYI